MEAASTRSGTHGTGDLHVSTRISVNWFALCEALAHRRYKPCLVQAFPLPSAWASNTVAFPQASPMR